MTKKDKQLLLIFFIVLAALVVPIVAMVLRYFILLYTVKDIFPRIGRPKELTATGVQMGAGVLTKCLYVKDDNLGNVTGIRRRKLDSRQKGELIIAGTTGAAVLDEHNTMKSFVRFDKRADHIDIIDIDHHGRYAFMNRGAWANDPSLIDSTGKTLWSYGGIPGVDDMCAGDIDGDGKPEFVVGFNGRKGIHLLDLNGKMRWSQPDTSVWHVEIGEVPGESSRVIIHTNSSFYLRIRDKEGRILIQLKAGSELTDFSLCRWPNDSSRQRILFAGRDSLWLMDFDGKSLVPLYAPKCKPSGYPRGTLAKLKPGEPEYFATIVDYGIHRRTLLCVYDSNATLVYEEILPEACEAISTHPLDRAKTEAIMVGGEGKVWEYR